MLNGSSSDFYVTNTSGSVAFSWYNFNGYFIVYTKNII